MQSRSLDKFKDDVGVEKATQVLNCSRMTLWNRIESKLWRVTETDDGHYEVWRTELKRRVLINE